MWTGKFSEPIRRLIGADIAFYDMLFEEGQGRVNLTGARAPFPWNNWADVLEPAAGTETLAFTPISSTRAKPRRPSGSSAAGP